mgnify:CR=1 FL=1
MARPKLPKLVKLKNRVLKRYPGAKCIQDSDGLYYISWNEENLNDIFLLNNTDPMKKLISEEKKNLNKERITNRIRKI